MDSKGNKRVLHTLNNTALATSRAMVAILENNQQKNGSIKIPKVLWKYTGFKEISSKKEISVPQSAKRGQADRSKEIKVKKIEGKKEIKGKGTKKVKK